MLVFGHRGASAQEPENTMRAFARALADGADGVELDVRLCATGELVVAHDPTFARRAGDPRVVGTMPWSELRRLDVGAAERVPLLEDVLAFAAERRAIVNIEVKTNGPRGPEVARELCRALARRGSTPERIVSSFDPRALAVVRRLAPSAATGLLFGAGQRWALRSGLAAFVVGATAVHPERWLVDARTVRAWHHTGRRVNVWTVDDAAELRRLAGIGADGVITNDPAAARLALAHGAGSGGYSREPGQS